LFRISFLDTAKSLEGLFLLEAEVLHSLLPGGVTVFLLIFFAGDVLVLSPFFALVVCVAVILKWKLTGNLFVSSYVRDQIDER
jgi:uncharacterized protein (DUF2062 family)